MQVQTSKNLQTGQSYMYKNQYNLKQRKKIITFKYVLSEFKERDFHGMGIKGGYMGAVVFERAWKDS